MRINKLALGLTAITMLTTSAMAASPKLWNNAPDYAATGLKYANLGAGTSYADTFPAPVTVNHGFNATIVAPCGAFYRVKVQGGTIGAGDDTAITSSSMTVDPCLNQTVYIKEYKNPASGLITYTLDIH